MKATVDAFVTAVVFPSETPGALARAWLRLQDDSRGHAFKVVVPLDFARVLSERLQSEDGLPDNDVRVKITYEFEEGSP